MCYTELNDILPLRNWPPELRQLVNPWTLADHAVAKRVGYTTARHPNYAQRFELVKMFAFAGVAPCVCVRALTLWWGSEWDSAALRHVQGLCGGRGKVEHGERYASVIDGAKAWWCLQCDPTRAVRHLAYEHRPHVVAAVAHLHRNGNHRKARLLQNECWLDSVRPWSFFVYNQT